MKKERGFFQWLSEGMDIPLDEASRKTVVELAQDRRVLVENHHGVIEYGSGCIGVKVDFGMLRVQGCGLELIQMTKEQLVIAGRIEEIRLIRRSCP